VRTLPVLYALEADATGSWPRCCPARSDDDEVERALELLRSSDALDRSRASRRGATWPRRSTRWRASAMPVVTALTRLAEYALDRAG
jgi:heptaprenyl diphosphate synthase